MASQEFLASFAVEIDEGGVSRLQEVLSSNRELAESLAGAFDSASSAIRSFAESLGVLPGLSSGGITQEGFSGLGGLALGLDTTAAEKDLQSFIAMAKKPVSLSANANGIVSAARSAYNSVKSLFSTPLTITAKVKTEKSSSGGGGDNTNLKMSTGGRFTKPTDVQVAEDGDAEYIIPVKKEDRAVPLLRRLLSELSPAARESLAGNGALSGVIPTGAEGGVEGSPFHDVIPTGTAGSPSALAAGSLGAGTISMDNRTVSAPVTIQVHASGADAERIGKSLYDTAERYLIRTLQGVMA